jgi:hypothetical protein
LEPFGGRLVPEQQRRIRVDLQKQLWGDAPFIPMGEYWQASAYHKRPP